MSFTVINPHVVKIRLIEDKLNPLLEKIASIRNTQEQRRCDDLGIPYRNTITIRKVLKQLHIPLAHKQGTSKQISGYISKATQTLKSLRRGVS